MQVGAMITVVGLCMLLIAEWRQHARLKWLAKPLASTGFLLAAMHAPGLHTSFGHAVFLALLLSWMGDVLLIPEAPIWFLCGLGSFLLAHVAFAVAFAQQGLVLAITVGAGGAMAGLGYLLWRWLHARIPPPMRGAVVAYIVTISVMVASASASAPLGPQPNLQVVAAGLFYASDIMVAKQQFTSRSFANKLVGLPLYYAAQLCMAQLLYPRF